MKLVVKKLEGCCYIDDVDDIVSVARVIGDGSSNGGGAKAEAIANLFAASPDLLRCLKVAVANFWGDYEEPFRDLFRRYYPNHEILQWEEVIAKAEK